jgi:phosphinothricin acetyltransferase
MSEGEQIRTRLATYEDASDIARIYNQGIEDRLATFETDLRSLDDIVFMLTDRGDKYPTVVVERGQFVVAWASVGAYRERPCYSGVGEFSVYVARECRGMGIGTVALRALANAVEERGFWKLVSRIFPENVASRALCRSQGFREVGVYLRHAKLDGIWKDCVIVERLLGEAAIYLDHAQDPTRHEDEDT